MATRKPAKKAPARRKPAVVDRLEKFGIDAVCEQIAATKSMTEIAKAAGVDCAKLAVWIEADPLRSARAREARALTARLWDEKSERVLSEASDPFALSKAKELSHHYRWRASKIAPKEYGDKTQVTGEGGGPLTVVIRKFGE